MLLRIKTKIAIGLVFLFVVIIINGGMGYYYLQRLSKDARAIIKDNYESVQDAENMSRFLDEYQTGDTSWMEKFERELIAEEHNITETGEAELVGRLRNQFEQLKASGAGVAQVNGIRQTVYAIADVNMRAITRKNNIAQQTAKNALEILAIISACSFLILFTFIINFPGYIASPVSKLTAGIKAIANRNYSERLHFSSHDEFGELARAFNSMAEKLDEYEHSNIARIKFEKKRIDTIIDNMRDAIIGLDENKKILFANPLAVSLLGLDIKKLAGAYAPDVAVNNDLLRSLLQENNSIHPLKIYTEGKESYFTKEILTVNIGEQVSGQQEMTNAGKVIILKNITQFQELDLAKTNFIATISHELKTPISSIKMSLKLLGDERVGKLNGEQTKLISHIRDDSQRLLGITKELLDLAQVETGNIQLHYQYTAPGEIIDYAYQALKMQAAQQQIKVEIHCDDHLPPVQADPEKTAWVMVNFLSNAIRYSPANSTIIMAAEQAEERIIFSVRDFGKGIDRQYKEKIFDKFFRVPDGSGTDRGGSGLGLAISREFITAQGGDIWVETALNEGSRFCFSLPVKERA